jgi:hypothetical protein
MGQATGRRLLSADGIVFALVDRRHGQKVETYATREEADADLRRVLRDEPELADVLSVEEVGLPNPSPN